MREVSASRGFVFTVRGLVRGREMAGDVTLALDTAGVRVERAESAAPVAAFRLEAIEGLRHEAGQLVLYLEGDDVLELSGERGLGMFARDLLARACALPEMTRALRALGAARSPSRVEHDRFFAPFLHARRRAESAGDPEAQVAAFDVSVLRARLDELASGIAAERYPEHPSARRALEAELSECLEPLEVPFARVTDAAGRLRAESEEMRLVAWRNWAAELRVLFACADRCWRDAEALLLRAAYEPDPWWQRVLRRSGRR